MTLMTPRAHLFLAIGLATTCVQAQQITTDGGRWTKVRATYGDTSYCEKCRPGEKLIGLAINVAPTGRPVSGDWPACATDLRSLMATTLERIVTSPNPAPIKGAFLDEEIPRLQRPDASAGLGDLWNQLSGPNRSTCQVMT